MTIYLLEWEGPYDLNDTDGKSCAQRFAASSSQQIRARYREILRASINNNKINIANEADAIQKLTPKTQADFIEIINNLK